MENGSLNPCHRNLERVIVLQVVELGAAPGDNTGALEQMSFEQAVVAPFRALLDRVPRGDWPKLNEEIHSAIRKYQDGNDLKFTATIVLGSGRKP